MNEKQLEVIMAEINKAIVNARIMKDNAEETGQHDTVSRMTGQITGLAYALRLLELSK